MTRRKVIATLRRLHNEGTAIDATWHRTDDLMRWRGAVEHALRAFSSDAAARFRSVRWADDPDATELELIETFELAVDDTLAMVAAAVHEAEAGGGGAGLPRWMTWAIGAAIAIVLAGTLFLMLRRPDLGHRGADAAVGKPGAVFTDQRFKIVQISDLSHIEGLERGAVGGLARVRTQRKSLEEEGVPVLVVYAGGVLSASVMRKYLGGLPMVSTMNLLDGAAGTFDPLMVSTFGNADLAGRSDAQLLEALRGAEFQWVATNIESCRAGSCVPFSSVLRNVETAPLIHVGGVPVGVIGLLYPLETGVGRTTPVIPAAKQAVKSLRDRGARVVIALTHQASDEDDALARAVSGIDLIIGGYDGNFQSRIVGGCRITKPDPDAKSVVIFDVTVPAQGKPKTTTPLRVVMDAATAPDPTVSTEVQRWTGELALRIGGIDKVGDTRTILDGTATSLRGRETALGNLLTDIIRKEMKTDVAVLNGGAVRLNDIIPPGPITAVDMDGIFYYSNRLVSFEATGAVLVEMLRNSVSRADMSDGRFLQVSGISFLYTKGANGLFAVRPEDVLIGGQPLALDRRYTVSTIEYLYAVGAGDGYTMFDDARRPRRLGFDSPDFRQVTERYLHEQGAVAPILEGRIRYREP